MDEPEVEPARVDGDAFSDVVQGVKEAARRTPSAPALTTGQSSTSFGELISRMDGLASGLRERGIGPGSIVAVCLERSVEMIVGIFGVLAAGAAYLPLDADVSDARLRMVVEHSGARLLLSRSTRRAPDGVTRYDPDGWPIDGPALPRENGPAYLIYTSGSTGKPKGVLIGDDALMNYVRWVLRSLTFTGAGVPLFGSIGYDHVITSLFPPLIAGEPLHLLPPITSGYALADSLLGGRRYSYAKLTPSHARMLSVGERAELGRCAATIVFGGEALGGELVAQTRRHATDLPVWNHYGPTEATVGCSAYRIPPHFEGANVPIGTAISGTVSVRDRAGDIVSAETPGELYVAGAGLAYGYWHDAELTNAAFVELPDKAGAVRRWYRTGDLVRDRGDGNLEFLGRIDDQVKILGHRIEPSEVESAIRLHPSVADVAVFANNAGVAVRLVAAIVTKKPVSDAEMRHHLRALLPSVMVPACIAFYERLPLNRNGKLDRDAVVHACDGAAHVSSDASVEALVLAKWRTMLGDEQIDVQDDFFEIGGDSMTEIEICLWATEEFGHEVEPTAIFDHPTVHSFSRHVVSLRSVEAMVPAT